MTLVFLMHVLGGLSLVPEDPAHVFGRLEDVVCGFPRKCMEVFSLRIVYACEGMATIALIWRRSNCRPSTIVMMGLANP